MTNKRKYEFLLADLSSLNGVGIKTCNLLKKKILTIYLTYCGNCQNHQLIGRSHQK